MYNLSKDPNRKIGTTYCCGQQYFVEHGKPKRCNNCNGLLEFIIDEKTYEKVPFLR